MVSMPSWELFDQQPSDYRLQVLPSGVGKLAMEAGSPRGWSDYVGDRDHVIGLNRFGSSAPGDMVLKQLGFHVEHVVERALSLLGR